jgi:hypothetical protein
MGWLPDNTILPEDAPIVERTLEVEIQEDVDAFILICFDVNNGLFIGDTWHVSLEEAKRQAKDYFGIEEDDWQSSEPTATLAGLV